MRKFYKFYTDKKHNITALKNAQFYAALVSQFNDPYEGLMKVGAAFCYYGGVAKEIVEEIRTRRMVVCLSESNDSDFVGKSLQMWAHYANNHFGFCVEYNDNILSGMRETGVENTFIKVNYSDELVPLVDCNGKEIKKTIPNPAPTIDDVNKMARDVLGTKETKWAYENEWRLIYRFDRALNEHKKEKGRLVDICGGISSINAIYIGLRTENWLRTQLIEFAFEHGIECYQKELNLSIYQLNKIKITKDFLTNNIPVNQQDSFSYFKEKVNLIMEEGNVLQ